MAEVQMRVAVRMRGDVGERTSGPWGAFVVEATGMEVHGDEVVFHRDGEVVLSQSLVSLGSLSWYAVSGPAYDVAEIRKTLPLAYVRWTTEERAQLRAECAESSPWKEIAQMHGRTVGGVKSEAKRLGLIAE